MLARLSAGQSDCRRRQADDDLAGCVKTTVLFLTVSGLKFMEFRDNVGDSTWFLMPFPDCLYHVTRRRYSHLHLPLSCAVIENRSRVFVPQFLRSGEPQKITTLCYRGLPCHMAKFGWVLRSQVRVQSLAMKKKRINFGWLMKTTVLFLAVSGPKLTKFWDDVADPR